ncbi:ADL190Cp [Eremothecium gossypii ATCC 10895]|uniref:ADL190Cp n=1 Tax=Eremothecium gossypii (strain ATCC 10895 / CBS 109.51 / FGSC 9923 / NRRL Y-1056) TaxID=284811 RepID=Q75AW0_EREGS|nr:ADL190Cp [Eremothecium gossypii ATCC 10895]AAS51730.1 ADL190Cp [Eremothecium gossypii ATCC 10895]
MLVGRTQLLLLLASSVTAASPEPGRLSVDLVENEVVNGDIEGMMPVNKAPADDVAAAAAAAPAVAPAAAPAQANQPAAAAPAAQANQPAAAAPAAQANEPAAAAQANQPAAAAPAAQANQPAAAAPAAQANQPAAAAPAAQANEPAAAAQANQPAAAAPAAQANQPAAAAPAAQANEPAAAAQANQPAAQATHSKSTTASPTKAKDGSESTGVPDPSTILDYWTHDGVWHTTDSYATIIDHGSFKTTLRQTTSYWFHTTLPDGSVSAYQSAYFQPFSKLYESVDTPKSGEVGMGTLSGSIGVVKPPVYVDNQGGAGTIQNNISLFSLCGTVLLVMSLL